MNLVESLIVGVTFFIMGALIVLWVVQNKPTWKDILFFMFSCVVSLGGLWWMITLCGIAEKG